MSMLNPSRLSISAQNLGLKTVGSPIENRGDGIGICEGYIAVAMPYGFSYRDIVDSPFGLAMVVDHSPAGVQDIVVFF